MKMEHAIGSISEGEWNNYGGIMCSSSTNEEADFMAQLLGNCSLPNETPNNSTFLAACWPVNDGHPNVEIASMEETSIYSSNNNNHNEVITNNNMFYYFSQSSIYSSHNNEMYATSDHQPYVFEGGNNSKDDTNFMESGDNFLNPQDSSNDSMEYSDEKKGDDDNNQNGFLGINLQLGMMEHQVVLPLPESSSADEKVSASRDNSLAKKRPPTHGNNNKRSVKQKKSQRVASSSDYGDDDKENAKNNNNSTPILQRQTSTLSYCSEDDSNVSLESNGVATTTSSTSKRGGKTRASRGSATDPQSLYARKRREKINERLRILQNLVPNGTKVDISTMLEEAVKYVNFLQLQIKLLSSDDLWMYAPIAYNGMDMGLDLKIASHNLSI